MIFLTEKIRNSNRIEVTIYDSLEALSESVEWQDLKDNSLKILDEEGKIYSWDDSQKIQFGTVFHYLFKVSGTDLELVEKCRAKYEELGQPDTFEMV